MKIYSMFDCAWLRSAVVVLIIGIQTDRVKTIESESTLMSMGAYA